MFNFKNLDSWQKEVDVYEGDLLICTGRRVGKTTILAKKAIDYMANNPNSPVIIISLTEDQAEIILSMALFYAHEAYPKLLGRGDNKPHKKDLTLNGGKMFIRPVGNTGDSIRGFEGGVLIVDEASRMPESFWIAAKPILLTTAGKMWIASTPFGTKGYFWERYNEIINMKIPNARFKVFEISTDEVINKRQISEDWTIQQREGALRQLEIDKREMTTKQYAQEYLGRFVSGLMQWFPDELIKACMKRERSGIFREAFCGIDIARMGEDETTWAIGNFEGDKLVHRELLITSKTSLAETIKTTLELNRIWDFEKILLDDEGIGVGVSDVLLDNDETKRKVIPINNSTRLRDYKEDKYTKILKEDLYSNLLLMMQRGLIEFLTDPKIMISLKSVQYDYTEDSSGKKHLKIFGNYTHIAESLIRLAYCEKYKSLNLWIKSI